MAQIYDRRSDILQALEKHETSASISDIVRTAGVQWLTACKWLGRLEAEGLVTSHQQAGAIFYKLKRC